ncbi:chemotaxis protein CheA [Nocardiopsis sp. RSe5-2]|uniref:Chemotaxis protein CheA n=1 Tax=Nocardiopsis endophytica TaxID=3018445 RepID=A0ABT4UD80_9ACTN|nr:chemotaxis protein CheA [Nocardiopsis endophytica]MDA2814272.1 chemotaxis protein CheA [Nocardiopsis endophytica]
MLRRSVVPALLAAGLSVAVAAPAAADAPEAGDAAQDLKSDHFYIDPSISDAVPADQQDIMASAAEDAESESPVYLVMLPGESFDSQVALDAYMDDLMGDVGDGVYAGFMGDGANNFFLDSPNLEQSELNQIRDNVIASDPGTEVDTLAAVPDAVAEQEGDAAASGMFGAAFLGLLVLAVAGGGYFIYSSRKKRAAEKAKELAEIKQMAQEDVVRLGEDIARLEIDLSQVDEATRTDYSHAMDSYDRAKATLDGIREPQDIQQVTNALEDGRYYMVATRARMNGDPVPDRRQPCFFNPQHGPSEQDVQWAPPGGAVRAVPACAVCTRAVLAGHDPDVRLVEVDGERRPYYDAGPAYAPYAGGYFGMSMMMGMFSGMMMGSMMGSMMGAGMMGAGDMGGGDMGGGEDFGGGDFGGDFGGDMDFGGFDF